MQKALTSVFALLLLASAVIAQQKKYAYGEVADLKDLTRVYVDTGTDTKSRETIIKELHKSKLGFEIVDSGEESQIVLGFGADSVANVVWTTSVASRVIEQPTGIGLVVAYARGKPRLILSFQDTQNSKFERSPVNNFTREFIKAYKKGNGLK